LPNEHMATRGAGGGPPAPGAGSEPPAPGCDPPATDAGREPPAPGSEPEAPAAPPAVLGMDLGCGSGSSGSAGAGLFGCGAGGADGGTVGGGGGLPKLPGAGCGGGSGGVHVGASATLDEDATAPLDLRSSSRTSASLGSPDTLEGTLCGSVQGLHGSREFTMAWACPGCSAENTPMSHAHRIQTLQRQLKDA